MTNGKRNGFLYDERWDPIALSMLEERLKANRMRGEMAANARSLPSEYGNTDDEFDPRRSVKDECGWPSDEPTCYRYEALFRTDPVANRVVTCWPSACWQVSPEIWETDEEEVTPFEEAVDELARTLRGEQSQYKGDEGNPLWGIMERADVLSRIGQYGILHLGFDDGQDQSMPVPGVDEVGSVPSEHKPDQPSDERGKDGTNGKAEQPKKDKELTANWVVRKPYRLTFNALDDPKKFAKIYDAIDGKPQSGDLGGEEDAEGAPKEEGEEPGAKGRLKLVFVQPYSEAQARITQWETNRGSPRYNQPVMYQVTVNDPRTGFSGIGPPQSTINVHWTRVIHVPCNPLSSEVLGVPAMRPVLTEILDCRKVMGASAEGYWKNGVGALSFETHPQLGGQVDVDDDELKDMMERLDNSQQKYMRLIGMSAKPVSRDLKDPKLFTDPRVDRICIALDFPKRIFIGSERGELASSQDDSDHNDDIKRRQNGFLTPRMVVPFFDRLIQVGALPKPNYKPKPKLAPMEARMAGEDSEAMRGEPGEEDLNPDDLPEDDLGLEDLLDEESGVPKAKKPAPTGNAFCPGEGARDNSCSSHEGGGVSSSEKNILSQFENGEKSTAAIHRGQPGLASARSMYITTVMPLRELESRGFIKKVGRVEGHIQGIGSGYAGPGSANPKEVEREDESRDIYGLTDKGYRALGKEPPAQKDEEKTDYSQEDDRKSRLSFAQTMLASAKSELKRAAGKPRLSKAAEQKIRKYETEVRKYTTNAPFPPNPDKSSAAPMDDDEENGDDPFAPKDEDLPFGAKPDMEGKGLSALPGPKEKPERPGYHVEWPDVHTNNDAEQADVANKRATALATYVSGQLNTLIPEKAFLVEEMGYTDEEAEAFIQEGEIKAIEAEEQEFAKQKRMLDEGLVPDPNNPDLVPDTVAGPPPFGGPPKPPGANPFGKGPPKPGGPPKFGSKKPPFAANAFCPGEGAKDNSCSSSEGGGQPQSSATPQSRSERVKAAREAYKQTRKEAHAEAKADAQKEHEKAQESMDSLAKESNRIIGVGKHFEAAYNAIDELTVQKSDTPAELHAHLGDIIRATKEAQQALAKEKTREGSDDHLSPKDKEENARILTRIISQAREGRAALRKRADIIKEAREIRRPTGNMSKEEWLAQEDMLWHDGISDDEVLAWHVANAFCPTGEGGGVDPSCSPGGSGGKVVDFGEKLPGRYDSLRGQLPKVTDKKAKEVRDRLQADGRLNADGTMSLFHDTVDDDVLVEKILKEGLIPAASEAPGQNWTAEHSHHATYFHQDKIGARGMGEDKDEGITTIEARIPITKEVLSRLLPDEDNDSAISDGIKDLMEGNGALAVLGGVPAKYLRRADAPAPKPAATDVPKGYSLVRGTGNVIRIKDDSGKIIHRIVGTAQDAIRWIKSREE